MTVVFQVLCDQYQTVISISTSTPVFWLFLSNTRSLPPLHSRWPALRKWWLDQKAHGRQESNRYSHHSWRDRKLFPDREAAREAGRGMAFEDSLYDSLGHTWEEIKPDGGRLVNISDRTNVQPVLNQDVVSFQKGTLKTAVHHFLDGGAMVSNGPEWKHSRDRIKPIFPGAEIRNLSMLRRHVDDLLAAIPCEGSTIDIQPPLKRMFFDNLSEFIFGESTNTLSDAKHREEAQELLASFDYALSTFLKRRRAGIFAVMYGRDTGLIKASTKAYSWIDERIRRALQAVSSQTGGQRKF